MRQGKYTNIGSVKALREILIWLLQEQHVVFLLHNDG